MAIRVIKAYKPCVVYTAYTGSPNKTIVMRKYLVLLWYKTGFMEFSVTSDKYPMYSEIVSASGISDDDIIHYEIHD